jgi:hypothetical protein
MFILDWSWGKIYAIHEKPDGSTYSGEKETFITGSPLPVTDEFIHPGEWYHVLCYWRKKSSVWTLSGKLTGKEKTAPISTKPRVNELAKLRQKLENLHIGKHPKALEIALATYRPSRPLRSLGGPYCHTAFTD